MGIEDELFNMFRYINMSGSSQKMKPADVNRLFASMLQGMEVSLLRQLRRQVDVLLHAREAAQKDAWKTEGVPYGSTTNYGDLDPFKILGVDMNSTKEEVDEAYRKKAFTAHPDRGGSHEDMVKVNAAYETICIFKGWER